MCHGMMVGRKVLTARSAKRCQNCGKPYRPGVDKIVRETVLEHLGGSVYAVWQCLRCASAWEHMTADTGECPVDPRGYIREDAKHRGWKKLRAALRNARKHVLSGKL